MNPHKYLRAYMAGLVVPTLAFPVGVVAFVIERYVYGNMVPLERVIIFPVAFVPLLWGFWNMLYVASHTRTHLSIGIHGAILPFLLGPLGIVLTLALHFQIPGFAAHIFPILAPVALIMYYLLWKYVVHFLNGVLGIA
jgi:hypothetical protein